MHKNKLRRMSLKCRIFKDENGNIDFVEAANGSRSKLFDTLVNITGGNKNTALNLYALTEVEDFKNMTKAKVSSIKNRVDKFVKKESQHNEAIKFSKIKEYKKQSEEYASIMGPLRENFDAMTTTVKDLLAKSKAAYQAGDYRKGAELEKQTLAVTTAFQDSHNIGVRHGQITGRKSFPESLSQFRGGRGTGHFGSGFYFTGVNASDLESLIKDSTNLQELGRTKVLVDFSKYNLLRVRDNEAGLELHESLKAFAGGAQISADTDFTKGLYREILNSEGDENGMHQRILEEVYSAAIGSLGAGNFNDNFVAETEDFDRSYEVGWLEGGGKSYFMESLNRALNNTLKSEIDYTTERQDVSSMVEVLPDSFSNRIDSIIEEIGAIPTDLAGKQAYFLNNYDANFKRLASAIVAVDSSKNVDEVYNKIKDVYSEIYGEYDPYNLEKSQKQTTIGTQILKELGYNGIDVRGVGESAGTTAMDNTSFGSVIYDINNTIDNSEPMVKEFLGGEDYLKYSKGIDSETKPEAKAILSDIIDRLKQTGLANNVFQLSNSDIQAKLVSLGVDANVAKQVMLSEEDINNVYYNVEEEAWDVYTNQGDYMQIYLDENATEEEVKKDAVNTIRDYYVEELPTVYRGINGDFANTYAGVQYFAVNKRYAGVFGKNIEAFRLNSPDILDLDEWNEQLGIDNPKVNFGQGFLTVHAENVNNVEEWGYNLFIHLITEGYQKEDATSWSNKFMAAVKKAKIIKGEDVGNKGEIVFAVKDKSLIEPINKQIQFQKTLLEKGIELTTAGFVYKNDVYLNNDAMSLDTPIHEFGHLHLDWLKANSIDKYNAGLSLVAKNKQEASEYVAYVKETQPNLQEGTEEFNNEVLAQVIGDQGAKLINNTKKNSIKQWLQDLWESIKGALGLSDYTAKQISDMTLAEFGQASATELLSGSRMQKTLGEDSTYLRYKYDSTQVARDRFDIPNLKKISSGSDRVVFDLGDGNVLKVANTARGLAQNMQEGDQDLIGKELVPQVYETGLNYVVAEKLELLQAKTKVPVYNISTGEYYDIEDADTMIEELRQFRQADFDTKDEGLVDVLKSYGLQDFLNYDIIYGDLTDIANWGIKEGKPMHLDAGTFGGMYMLRKYAKRKDLSFSDFQEVYDKSQEARDRFNDKDGYVNFSIVAGNKLFNSPLEDAGKIAEEYMLEKGFSTEPIQRIEKLNEATSRKIAAEFSKMEITPNDPKTKESYKAMVEETVEQYKKILSKGYKIELNNLEPYTNSEEMITDLRNNKRMRILSTEEGFGEDAITDIQREGNPLLGKTKFKDVNGVPLLANDIFRFVHDFFGHAKLGNGFGAIGEENAWNIHSRMYTPLARQAMTTETRGQNSWVNFSGVNDKAFELRDKARVLRREGRIEEAKNLTNQVYNIMKFADQKIGLMPIWTSQLNITDTGERMVAEVNGSKVYFRDEKNPINNKSTGNIEIELVETPEELRGQGRAREALNTVLKYTDSIGKNTVLTVSTRDKNTTNKGLEKFYTSLGYNKTSDFEMKRPARKLSPKGYDENGEPSVQQLMDYKNSSSEPLSLEDQIISRNTALALGVTSSEELIGKLEKAIVKSGVIVFDSVSLQRGGVFNKYEATKIMNSLSLQKSIRQAYLQLKNTEPFVLEYDKNFVAITGSEINIFGKQPVSNPFITEAELAKDIAGIAETDVLESLPPEIGNRYSKEAKFKTAVNNMAKNNKLTSIKVVREGQLVDKVEDIENTLANTLIDTENPNLAENIRYIKEDISEEVWDENLNLIVKVMASIKKNAIANGIDLRDVTTKVLSTSREDILSLLDTMENLFQEGMNENTVIEFSDTYKSVFDIDTVETDLIQTDSEFDTIIESNLSEYQLFDNFGVVKKQGDIYRQTEEQSLEDLYDSTLEYPELIPEGVSTVDDLKSFVEKEITNLEIADYEVDPDKLAKIYLYKKNFGFPIKATPVKVSISGLNKVTSDPAYLVVEFVKEFNKWILETKNEYFKVTSKGIELVENDPLSKEEAILTVPEEFKKDLSEYDAISKNLNLGIESEELVFEDYDSQTQQREFFANNPESAKKLSGEYLYIEEGVLATKNETDTFIRTPQGVFEMIYEAGNVKFYNKLPSTDANFKLVGLEKPLSDINFNKYQYLENTPEVFKVAKNYYSKQELNQIDRDYFSCQ